MKETEAGPGRERERLGSSVVTRKASLILRGAREEGLLFRIIPGWGEGPHMEQ